MVGSITVKTVFAQEHVACSDLVKQIHFIARVGFLFSKLMATVQ